MNNNIIDDDVHHLDQTWLFCCLVTFGISIIIDIGTGTGIETVTCIESETGAGTSTGADIGI